MRRAWTEEEVAAVREAYTARASEDIGIAGLAARLGRTLAAVHLKASKLGLGNFARPKVKTPKGRPNKYATEEDLRAAQGQFRKEWIAKNGHPRGMLGLKHTAATLGRMSAASYRAWADPTSKHHAEGRGDRQAALNYARVRKQIASGNRPISYTRAAGGRRPDLGDTYFRSSWEANYARYLNLLKARGEILDWAYEWKTFEFEPIKRGSKFYTPDFRVVFPDHHHEWHEVKGWMDQKSRTKLARMARYFPEEVVKVIGVDWFRQAQRGGLDGIVPGWERGQRL